jgi:tRNA threonylcarbamoyladenosine biosynthesis protein TsaB
VIVSRGPGSYTGLRVGVMSAKTLAFAVGCRLLALDTFAAIARQAPPEAQAVDVVADAQQNRFYIQRYVRQPTGGKWQAQTPLSITPIGVWLPQLAPGVWASGPGLAGRMEILPSSALVVPEADWHPRAESLLALGIERWQRGEHDDPFAAEPLYLRPSSAEEQWGAKEPGRK